MQWTWVVSFDDRSHRERRSRMVLAPQGWR